MTREVTFNGITRSRPGGISRVRVDNLAQVGDDNRSIYIIGEATGGEPGATAGLVSFASPAGAVDEFRSGPIVEALNLAFQSSRDRRVPGGAGEVVVYKTNSSVQSDSAIAADGSSAVADTAAAASTTTAVNLTTGGLAVDELVGYFVDITLSDAIGTPTLRRRITANTASQITVTPALPSAPVFTDVITVRNTAFVVTSRDYGAHTNSVEVDYTYTAPTGANTPGYQVTVAFEDESQASPTLGETPRMFLQYVGGANAVAQDTIANTATTLTATNIDVTAGGLVPGAHNGSVVVVADAASGLSERVRVDINTPTNLTLLDALSAELVAAIQAAGDGVSTVDIQNVTAGTVTVAGANGVATGLSTTISGVAGDNLAIAFSTGMTITQLAALINQNTSYRATIPNNVNGDTATAASLDFDGGSAFTILADVANRASFGAQYYAARAFYADVTDMVSWFNESAQYGVAARATALAGDGTVLAFTDLQDGPIQLTGGSRGTSSNSSFQDGLDLGLTRQMGYVVPLIDQDLINEGNGSTATWGSVSQQLLSHVLTARGSAGLERGAFIGFVGNKAEYIDACNSLNDEDIQCVSQYPTVVDSSGTSTEQAPAQFAVMGASMRAGVNERALPLTNKLILCSALRQDATWEPADLTDSQDLIKNGAFFAEEVPGRGFRWVRDLTTYIKDDHICCSEGSVRDAIRFAVYTLRTGLDEAFTGLKATPANIASVKDVATIILDSLTTQEVIVSSTDPVTGDVTGAYTGLKVTSSGDVIRLSVCIFPVPGINFQLSDIFVKVPTQSV